MDITMLVVAFVVGTALSAAWLWAVTKLSLRSAPTVDFLIIAGLCTGLALLTGPGLVLAAIIMALLTTRVTGTDTWPAVVMIAGSSAVWLATHVLLLGRP